MLTDVVIFPSKHERVEILSQMEHQLYFGVGEDGMILENKVISAFFNSHTFMKIDIEIFQNGYGWIIEKLLFSLFRVIVIAEHCTR